MRFSAADARPHETDGIRKVAQRLCGATVLSLERRPGGGNNQVYRAETSAGPFALKVYGSTVGDDRDRLGHEFDGLSFLRTASGASAAIPGAIAADRGAGCAVYEWIEGEPLNDDHGVADVAALLGLLRALHAARQIPAAQNLPDAAEATLRLRNLTAQIDLRLERLASVAPSEPQLSAFLESELAPELRRRLGRLVERDWDAALKPPQRTLSPSDFGFHNALRRPDGSLVFIDFEYFGWDDPVKLTADFLWHPAMTLSGQERLHFLSGATDLYGEDADFLARLAVSYPLHGIRWCLIILNEFLPSMWQRRMFAGRASGDWEGGKARQLAKARSLLESIGAYHEGQIA